MCTAAIRCDSSAIRWRIWIDQKRCLVGKDRPRSSAYIYKVYSALLQSHAGP